MIKIIFVLVINAYHGGMTTIDFPTLQQCETAREKIQTIPKSGSRVGAVCIEKKVPIKRTKCKFSNEFARSSGNFYPVAFECVEE